MNQTTHIFILNRKVTLYKLDKTSLRGLAIGDKLAYTFYGGEYMGTTMIFLKPTSNNPTPRTCSITTSRLSEKFGKYIVFILQTGPYYERQRLLDKGVYFVMSEKFAHLPMLVSMERIADKKKATQLTPVAQYMLLYHLQTSSIAGMTATMMKERLPYSYASITLGMTCLEELDLAKKNTLDNKSKVLNFETRGIELWEKAAPFLVNPVEKIIYCDEFARTKDYPICNINALAHYSTLVADKERMLAVTLKDFKELQAADAMILPNSFDGNVLIEQWKYPPLVKSDGDEKYVDPLSLALSLKDDEDARVEKEVERMINNIVWKD